MNVATGLLHDSLATVPRSTVTFGTMIICCTDHWQLEKSKAETVVSLQKTSLLNTAQLPAQTAIGAGKLHPFAAAAQDVLDNEGHILIPRASTLTDGQILSMNALVAGVIGKIAK